MFFFNKNESKLLPRSLLSISGLPLTKLEYPTLKNHHKLSLLRDDILVAVKNKSLEISHVGQSIVNFLNIIF